MAQTTTQPPLGAVPCEKHVGMAMIPVRIYWRWESRSGVHEDDPNGDPDRWYGFIHDDECDPWQLSYFWWFEGNGSCDCNRSHILGLAEEKGDDCGEEIVIDRIEAIGIEGVRSIAPDSDEHVWRALGRP